MGITLQLPNVQHHITTFFHRLMSQPPSYVQGLFAGAECRVETSAWHNVLRDDAGSCKLTCLELCKTRSEKFHEFLILYFSHPTHPVARAAVVVHREVLVKDGSNPTETVSQSVPSENAAEAFDMVYVVGRRQDNLETYLSKTYHQYDKLCTLKYPSSDLDPNTSVPSPPSAVEFSTLLLVASNHKPNYNVHEYNGYWYTDMVFEACKKLFPGCREDCIKHGDRGRCRFNFPELATHSLTDICNEYSIEWKEVTQRRARREIITQQVWERMLEEERRAHEAAQQELGRKLEEERRAAREVTQEWERKVEEERRAHEVAQQELKRRLEEAESRCQRLQAAETMSSQVPI